MVYVFPFVIQISYVDFMTYHTIDEQKRTQDLKVSPSAWMDILRCCERDVDMIRYLILFYMQDFPNLAKFIKAFSARENIAKYLTVAPPKTE